MLEVNVWGQSGTSKGTGLQWLGHQILGHKGPVQQAYVHRERNGSNSFAIGLYSILRIYKRETGYFDKGKPIQAWTGLEGR
jgi:hypothetical protein